MESVSAANILPTAPASTSAGASAVGQASVGAASDQGAQGAFGDLLAQQIALTVPQVLSATKLDVTALLANTNEGQVVDPALLIQQINMDLNQLVAVDPALAEILKKLKQSEEDNALGTDASLVAASAIPVGNLPPNFAATAEVTGKDLPKLAAPVVTSAVTPNEAAAIQANPVSSTEDKALAAFATEMAAKLEQIRPDHTQKIEQTPQLQQAPLNVISSASTVNTINSNSAHVAPSVGSQHWDTALGEKVVWIVGTQTKNAELHLNPPSLGPLEIRVSMSDGQANLSFMTQHAAVRDAIEAAAPKLREMMGDSGINMGGMSVNVGTFAQQQDQAAQQQAANNRNNASANDLVFGATADNTTTETVTTTVQPLRDLGLVDLFA